MDTNKEKRYIPCKRKFYNKTGGYNGVYITRTCLRDVKTSIGDIAILKSFIYLSKAMNNIHLENAPENFHFHVFAARNIEGIYHFYPFLIYINFTAKYKINSYISWSSNHSLSPFYSFCV